MLLLACFTGSVLQSNGLPFHHHHPRFAKHNYRDALTKSIIFFEGQRSGRLPSNQRIIWRKDSGLSDGAAMHVDLVGGCYDAGDNVKFGFPMAFTTTMLSWSVIEFATAHPDTIYVQVGDANKDHSCWERPKDMDTPRSVFKIDKHSPGSEVAGETAAALPAALLVFIRSDPTLLEAFVCEFADEYRGPYSNGLKKDVCPFYSSYSGCCAAWLHRATKNPVYLNYIQVNGRPLELQSLTTHSDGITSMLERGFFVPRHFWFKDCNLSMITRATQIVSFALLYQEPHSLQLNILQVGCNMQYVTSTSFLLLTYAKYLTSANQVVNCGGTTFTPKRLRTIAKKQADYLLGDNPLKMSYMVGYGPRYPQRIHHRGSSLPSVAKHPAKIQCSAGFNFMNSQSPNPNILMLSGDVRTELNLVYWITPPTKILGTS
ncbi:hypothetical protein DITRI_Ditri11bG0111300 [Diplodiscus trichospermus]